MNGNIRKRHPGQHNGGQHSGGQGRRPYQKFSKPQHGGGGNYNNQQRPRKNFPALREKYLNQAKDALSAGDRVLAEYYFQHADHYYRMQMEYLEQRARWQEQNQANQQDAAQDADAENDADQPGDDEPEVDIPNNSNVLPAYLTRKVPVQAPADTDDKADNAQEWEEER